MLWKGSPVTPALNMLLFQVAETASAPSATCASHHSLLGERACSRIPVVGIATPKTGRGPSWLTVMTRERAGRCAASPCATSRSSCSGHHDGAIFCLPLPVRATGRRINNQRGERTGELFVSLLQAGGGGGTGLGEEGLFAAARAVIFGCGSGLRSEGISH